MRRANSHRVSRSVWSAPLLMTQAALGQAGGLYLPENGGPINGTAQAGSAAVARDAETAWLNPAGMTRLDEPELMLTLMPFYLDSEFNLDSATTSTGGDGGQQGGILPGGGLFIAAPISDRISFGFGVYSLAGLILDPDDGWAGRTRLTKTELLTLNVAPSIGVRLSDQWSVGGSLVVQYARFEQDLVGPLAARNLNLEGDSLRPGVSASVLWEPLETTRFGLRYMSPISHDLDGNFTLATRSPRSVSTSLDLPMSLTFSAYHEFNESFALLFDAGWTDWSGFERNTITFDSSGGAVELARNFRDVWNVSLGTHIRATDDLLVMLGGGYTSSAVSDGNRTPDLPVDQQVRGSVGLEYRLSDRWKIGANYTLLWLGDNKIDQAGPLGGRIVGDYDFFAHIAGFYASVSF